MEGGTNTSWSFQKLLKLRREAHTVISSGATSIREIWEAIRVKGNKVHWHNLIWFPLHIPKHIMIVWMTFLDRLPTKNRLQHMRIANDELCVLCKEARETRNHLFIECPPADSLWKAILLLSGLKRPSLTWDNMITWACNSWKGESLLTTVLKIAWSALIYSLWEERNARLFKGNSRSAAQILSAIKDIVVLTFTMGKTDLDRDKMKQLVDSCKAVGA
ncbi:uncharacterized protein LOC120166517 [Hibiscus syriacus]|uniref:uncharacterized protein LOC120166517 n=1 Tax=Hibiscus syriacus TaxID=106335 RepID=UPI001923C118|nr:uncharacterized protein LOC120166517 [Hibiscus syriacus]